MANHPSAAKRNRQRQKRTVRNRDARSTVRTILKKARAALAAGEKDAKAKVDEAAVALAKAAKAGVLHANTASRTTARIRAALSKRAAS
ncbi:MAG TPA: 30S ribosomal protein S20 [Polyangiaceae bacterium]|nr:30S ribosomal protein S20 [Polyangiaceae bacterium]